MHEILHRNVRQTEMENFEVKFHFCISWDLHRRNLFKLKQRKKKKKYSKQKLEDTYIQKIHLNTHFLQLEPAESSNKTFWEPPFKYRDGPHPLISGYNHGQSGSTLITFTFPDSLFSLIIFIYVAVTFLYVFYAFCWRTEVHKPMPDGRVRWSFFMF